MIVSLQGRTQATWLEVVRKEAQRIKVEVDVPHGDDVNREGFAVLHSRGNSSRLVSLEGAPDAGEGSRWTVAGEKLTGPGSKVVGYQLCVVNVGAASGYVDSARFLFRPFAPPGETGSKHVVCCTLCTVTRYDKLLPCSRAVLLGSSQQA